MPQTVARITESEKITINLGPVDLGHIDLLVGEGVYANRSDLIRSAIRREIDRHSEITRQSIARKPVELGLRHYRREDLETLQAQGKVLEIRVLGLAVISADVSAELARATIASVEVLGSLQASPAVRAALHDRIR